LCVASGRRAAPVSNGGNTMIGIRYIKSLAVSSATLVLATVVAAHGNSNSSTAPLSPAVSAATVFATPWRSAPTYAPARRAAFLFTLPPVVRGLAPHIAVSGGIHPSNFDIPL